MDNIKVEVTEQYIKKTMKFKDAAVLQINIKFPNIKNRTDIKIGKRINDFYNSVAKNFSKSCEKILYKSASAEFLNKAETDGFKPFGAVMTFDAVYNARDILCIYLDTNIYSGKGRGNIVRAAHIWDTTSGELLPPGRFIKFDRRIKYKICGYISGIMEKQMQDGKESYINSDIASVCKYLDKQNFSLSENGWSFFFPQNTVAPFNSGIVSFDVPEGILAM